MWFIDKSRIVSFGHLLSNLGGISLIRLSVSTRLSRFEHSNPPSTATILFIERFKWVSRRKLLSRAHALSVGMCSFFTSMCESSASAFIFIESIRSLCYGGWSYNNLLVANMLRLFLGIISSILASSCLISDSYLDSLCWRYSSSFSNLVGSYS